MPFWRVTRPTNSTYGSPRVKAMALETSRAGVGEELVGVDAVVDNLHPCGVDGRVDAQDVVADGPADGDHGIGALDGGALDPADDSR